ncbi:hypothetical protein PENTCL1PPCAC_763, partial [Pristionchus entomophagus]
STAMKNEKLFMILAYPIIILVALVAVAFLASPIVLYTFPQMHKFFIAHSLMITPPIEDIADLHSGSFFISVGSSTLAVWHIAPKIALEAGQHKAPFWKVLGKKDYRIVMYFHSRERDPPMFSSFCRMLLNDKRVEDRIQIISFDYKGFGNSSGETTQSGAIEDTLSVYYWLRRNAHPETEIHFWSHGLGAGIASATAQRLITDGEEVKSLVLEAPFYDTLTMLKSSSWIVRLYDKILYKSFFPESLKIIDLNFNTTMSISKIDVPTLVLSGEHDDKFKTEINARELVRVARRHRDFLFHIEWRCPKITHWPGQQASNDEMKQILNGFRSATAIFWNP